jgi:hypothetical protein
MRYVLLLRLRYRLDSRGVEKGTFFDLVYSASCHVDTRMAIYLGTKWPGREADHSTSTSAGVKINVIHFIYLFIYLFI